MLLEGCEQDTMRKEAVENERRQMIRKWKAVYQEMTRERGIWATENPPVLHWKLDKTENAQRMRRKLIVRVQIPLLCLFPIT